MTAIHGRRSVRSYAPGKLGSDVVHTLLAAAVQAPTAIHEEPWAFVVLHDAKLLQRISDRARGFLAEEARRLHREKQSRLPEGSRTEFSIFYNAETLVVIYAKTGEGRFVVADCWLAAENLMLAAYSMGLGSCVIGSAVPAMEDAETRAELGIPDGFTAFVPVIVGVPTGDIPPVSRKEPEILVWK